jgi:hypothetical protein
MNSLTEDLKNLARDEGADLVGVASVDRFFEDPEDDPPAGNPSGSHLGRRDRDQISRCRH